MKLLVFLIKTKVLIKMLENCQIIRENDLFTESRSSHRWNSFEKYITYVQLSSEDKCVKQYQQIGQSMKRIFFSLLKANKIIIDYKKCMEMIKDPKYYEKCINEEKMAKLEHKLSQSGVKNILKPATVFNYIGSFFQKGIEDYTDLHYCFPDPEFLFMYYKLIDSKWTKLGMKIISKSVSSKKKFYIPLDIFEDEFEENHLFPQTRVRLLKNRRFAKKIPGEFFVQKEFLLKRSFIKSSNEKFSKYFTKAIKEYKVFDRKYVNSKAGLSLYINTSPNYFFVFFSFQIIRNCINKV